MSERVVCSATMPDRDLLRFGIRGSWCTPARLILRGDERDDSLVVVAIRRALVADLKRAGGIPILRELHILVDAVADGRREWGDASAELDRLESMARGNLFCGLAIDAARSEIAPAAIAAPQTVVTEAAFAESVLVRIVDERLLDRLTHSTASARDAAIRRDRVQALSSPISACAVALAPHLLRDPTAGTIPRAPNRPRGESTKEMLHEPL